MGPPHPSHIVVTLAKSFKPEKNKCKNWYLSEKFDGLRAFWNGREFFSRNGNKFTSPEFFTKDFPNC